MTLLLHPQTRADLATFERQPSHALVISGPPGSGKLSIAIQLSENLLGLEPGTLNAYAYGKIIRPVEEKSIGIETVRELEHFLSLKVPTPHAVNRAIVLADSHLMTTEAQNALLKTIEEPPAGTVLILTTAHEQALLPTIRSRAQRIAMRRPELAALEAYFIEQGFEATDVKRTLAMSGGLVGLTQALLSDTDHLLLVAAHQARELLSQPTFERLIHVDELAQQRLLCLNMLFIMQQMAHLSLQRADKATKATKHWQTILAAAYDAQSALRNGAQPKLALSDFLLKL